MMNNSILFDEIFEYRIVGKREGGMGEVLILERISEHGALAYFIHQKKLAAKTFKDHIKANKDSFEREISIWLNFHDYVFQQSKIVKLLKTTRIRNKLYALMPFYDGSVSDLIKNQKNMNSDEAIMIIGDIVDGLRVVFEKYGVVHQDLKPENILWKKGYNARDEFHVSDWGISNIQRGMCPEIPTNEWLPSSFVEIMSNSGTLPYMSPERFYGEYSNVSADIYAVGLMFFEILFGSLPFQNNKPLEQQIIEGDYFDVACWVLKKKVSNAKLIEFIQTCIHPNASKRYPEYKSLEKALKRIQRKWVLF